MPKGTNIRYRRRACITLLWGKVPKLRNAADLQWVQQMRNVYVELEGYKVM